MSEQERTGFPPKGEHRHLVAAFSSERIPLLNLFRGDEEVEAIHAIHVRQHPEGGVLLCALDGHHCCLVRDPNGWARRPVNFYPGRDTVKHCRVLRKGGFLRRIGLGFPAQGKRNGLATLFSVPDLAPEHIQLIQPWAVGEGPYPDITTFMARLATATQLDINDVGLNAESLARLAKAGVKGVRVRAGGGNDSPLFVVGNELPDVLFVIMPMKIDLAFDYRSETEVHPFDYALEWVKPGMAAWAKAEQARLKAARARKPAVRLAKAA